MLAPFKGIKKENGKQFFITITMSFFSPVCSLVGGIPLSPHPGLSCEAQRREHVTGTSELPSGQPQHTAFSSYHPDKVDGLSRSLHLFLQAAFSQHVDGEPILGRGKSRQMRWSHILYSRRNVSIDEMV